jgi:hypothetical protein
MTGMNAAAFDDSPLSAGQLVLRKSALVTDSLV